MGTIKLIDTANVVFRAIGERPVTSLTNTKGDRLKDCIKQACRDIETLHSWDWLSASIIASSWQGRIATTVPTQRIITVSIGSDTNGYSELRAVPEYVLDRIATTPYTGVNDLARTYAMLGDNKYKFAPYPNDTESRGRIRFYVQLPIDVPVLDAGVFSNVPDRYITLIEKKASHLMCVRYLDDANTASYFQQEFEQLVQQYRNFERGTPVRGTTMYRRSR